MPVEVKELVIRTVLNPEAPTRKIPDNQLSKLFHGLSDQELIQKCVNEVLRILKQKETR